MRLDRPIGLVAAVLLGGFGVGALWFALFEGGPGPYIGSATDVASLLGFLFAVFVAVLVLARRRSTE